MTEYCPECGEEVEENQNFCDNCGATLKEADQEEVGNDREDDEEHDKSPKSGKSNSLPIGKKNILALVLLALVATTGVFYAFQGDGTESIESDNLIQVDSAQWLRADDATIEGEVKLSVPSEAEGSVCFKLEETRDLLFSGTVDCINPGESEVIELSYNDTLNRIGVNYGESRDELDKIKRINVGNPSIELIEVSDEPDVTVDISQGDQTETISLKLKNSGNIPIDPNVYDKTSSDFYITGYGMTKQITDYIDPGETGEVKYEMYIDPPENTESGDRYDADSRFELATVSGSETIEKEFNVIFE